MYDIELATARVDAAITYARFLILNLLDGDTPNSRALAVATQTILDDHLATLESRMDQLEHTVRRHHQDPSHHQPSEANLRRAQELSALTERCDRHMTRTLQGNTEQTAESTWLAMTVIPQAQAAAVQGLLAETLARDPQDETALAYRQAAREAARDNVLHRTAITRSESHQENEPHTPLSRSMLQRATQAMDTIDRLIPPGEQNVPGEETPDQPVRTTPPAHGDTPTPTATRFHDRLRRRYQEPNRTSPIDQWCSRWLLSTDTKRILFDSRQAVLMAQAGENLPEHIQGRLRTPFDILYLEFTQPIWLDIGLYEKRVKSLRAMLVVPYQQPADTPMGHPLHVTAWITEDHENISTISFLHNLATGHSHCPAGTIREAAGALNHVPPQVPGHLDDDQTLRIGPDEGRTLGSVEEMIWQTGQLLNWTCAYMMAKSIRIVEERPSRQVRRNLARRGIPNPWHVVRVDPRITGPEPPPDIETGQGPGIRFDVIGHLRFGRHRLRDGSHRASIEWVRPHQRGLANQLYIPKTSRFQQGRPISPRMAEYWGPPQERESPDRKGEDDNTSPPGQDTPEEPTSNQQP